VSNKGWENVSTIQLPFVLGEPDVSPHSYEIEILCENGEFIGSDFQELFNRGNENENVK
jgi:hypothetical protein